MNTGRLTLVVTLSADGGLGFWTLTDIVVSTVAPAEVVSESGGPKVVMSGSQC